MNSPFALASTSTIGPARHPLLKLMFKFIRKPTPELKGADELNALAAETSLPKILDLSQAKRVLLFAPHPDDECIAYAGTLALLSQSPGVEICVVLVTNGDGGQHSPEPEMSAKRIEEMRQALKVLNIDQLQTLDFADGRFLADSTLLEKFSALIERFQPNWVFSPSPIDYHKDHLLISHALTQCCQLAPSVEQLIYGESWTPVPATHVVDISSVMNLKMKALSMHETALKYGDYARAVEGLNAYRGLYLGFDRFAEAFMVVPMKAQKKARLNSERLLSLGLELKKLLSS